jgi:MscS family membrane protein
MRVIFIYILLLTVFCNVTFSQPVWPDSSIVVVDTVSVPPYMVAEKKSDSFLFADIIDDIAQEIDSVKQEAISVFESASVTPVDALNVISFSNIFWAIVLFIIGFVFNSLVVRLLEVVAERSSKLRITIKSIIPIIRIFVWLLVVFVIVKGVFNPPFETIIAVTASVAIAIGLAAQDLLKNVFGGIMLLFDRPFQVGDKIEAGKYYGEVLKIGLRATRLVTVDDSVVSVPNMELMNSSVSNANSGELNCQVVAELYLPLHIDTQKARKIAIETAQTSRFVFLNKPIVVIFNHVVIGPRSYLQMRIKAYVMDIRYECEFRSDMTEVVLREFFEQGVVVKGEVM